MIRSAKKLEQLSALLERNDNLVISEAVRLLRDEQPFEGAIRLLAALYNRTEDHSVRKAVEEFMNDLKDQSACSEVIAEITKYQEPKTLSMLVASCWQSGLDYSEFLPEIAGLFSECDYLTAIECFTLIEETTFHFPTERKNELIEIIRKGSSTGSDEKKKLLQELVKVLGE